MNKILSINTIKNVFAALGAKTSDDNYGVALLDKDTAEPKGLMGMSDLASVLGVNKPLIKYQSSSSGANIMLYALSQLSEYNRKYPVRGIALVYLESGAWQLFSFDYLHGSYFTTAKIQGDTDISTNEVGTIGYGQYLWVIPFNLF